MSSKCHFKPAELLKGLCPADLGLEYTSVQRLELSGGTVEIETAGEEVCLAVLEGDSAYRIEGVEGTAVAKDMLYAPRRSRIALCASAPSVVMRYGAPAHIDTEFTHLPFAQIDAHPSKHACYGKLENNTRREVWHFIGDDFKASRLMMGICRGGVGGWTSWPPHEHSRQREEVYTYFDMGRAFALQCVYEDMNDARVALVTDGDLVSIPRGYHPNAGSPAGRICFVYCMAAATPGKREFMDLRIQEIYGDRFE